MYFNGNNLILILKTFKVIYFGNPNRTPRDDMGTGTPGDVSLSFRNPKIPIPSLHVHLSPLCGIVRSILICTSD